MTNGLKGLRDSKKFTFIILLVALLMLGRKFGVHLSMEELIAIFGLAGVGVAGQAYAERDEKRVNAEAEAKSDKPAPGGV